MSGNQAEMNPSSNGNQLIHGPATLRQTSSYRLSDRDLQRSLKCHHPSSTPRHTFTTPRTLTRSSSFTNRLSRIEIDEMPRYAAPSLDTFRNFSRIPNPLPNNMSHDSETETTPLARISGPHQGNTNKYSEGYNNSNDRPISEKYFMHHVEDIQQMPAPPQGRLYEPQSNHPNFRNEPENEPGHLQFEEDIMLQFHLTNGKLVPIASWLTPDHVKEKLLKEENERKRSMESKPQGSSNYSRRSGVDDENCISHAPNLHHRQTVPVSVPDWTSFDTLAGSMNQSIQNREHSAPQPTPRPLRKAYGETQSLMPPLSIDQTPVQKVPSLMLRNENHTTNMLRKSNSQQSRSSFNNIDDIFMNGSQISNVKHLLPIGSELASKQRHSALVQSQEKNIQASSLESASTSDTSRSEHSSIECSCSKCRISLGYSYGRHGSAQLKSQPIYQETMGHDFASYSSCSISPVSVATSSLPHQSLPPFSPQYRGQSETAYESSPGTLETVLEENLQGDLPAQPFPSRVYGRNYGPFPESAYGFEKFGQPVGGPNCNNLGEPVKEYNGQTRVLSPLPLKENQHTASCNRDSVTKPTDSFGNSTLPAIVTPQYRDFESYKAMKVLGFAVWQHALRVDVASTFNSKHQTPIICSRETAENLRRGPAATQQHGFESQSLPPSVLQSCTAVDCVVYLDEQISVWDYDDIYREIFKAWFPLRESTRAFCMPLVLGGIDVPVEMNVWIHIKLCEALRRHGVGVAKWSGLDSAKKTPSVSAEYFIYVPELWRMAGVKVVGTQTCVGLSGHRVRRVESMSSGPSISLPSGWVSKHHPLKEAVVSLIKLRDVQNARDGFNFSPEK